MAFLTVPYNNAMLLGQGFNSYTQSLCLDRAVVYKGAEEKANTVPDVTRIPQIVTYSSHFVDKLSDVVKALNVSAALSVKVGTVTGSGSGSYVDEDKIKESDINFIITVKVTNQAVTMPGEAQFNSIDGLDPSKFTEIYGDTFISGFLEGGEFVGIVNIKVKDSSQVEDIKAQLEVGFSAVQAKGAGGYVDSKTAKGTETSVSVNWSGGGKIKEAATKWDVQSMLDVAAAFPEYCARCPQRTSAIVTKYNSLYSYLKFSSKFATLSYDNAGVYTADLLDDYMDYKMQWKTVRLMGDSIKKYQKSDDPDGYPATFAGIDAARREILKQMVLIVNEVDIVRINPAHAQDAILNGTAPYINPAVFEARIPVIRPPPPPPPPPEVSPTAVGPDPKAWMWVKFPGRDSPGNDLMNVNANWRDLMLKVIEWEAANPGQYVKCFNTNGWIKNKCLKASQLVPGNADLYIRIQINDRWLFVPGVESGGNDIPCDGFSPTGDANDDIDIVDCIRKCETRADIMAFNSIQWTKNAVNLPMPAFAGYQGRPHQGIWIRKTMLQM